jgi:diaminohydroxyphosphoribosylaminopyrimidine deaminase/5-amino-6-(5-phosphoribosylamino)uracil reductase
MQRALALAEAAIGLTEPNPRVGCVLVAPDGRVLGEGHTQQAGGPHAEVMALRAAQAAGEPVQGATAYVTLEPCSHHGRTPPCCDALIAAGLRRVVAACTDPNPLVAGQGLARLQAAGVVVEQGLLGQAAAEINLGFFSRMVRGRPWARAKVAASLDGRTALPDGRSQWITSAAARADGHRWRQRAGAILTGVGTLLADDPRLDVRLPPADGAAAEPVARQPLRVVLDSQLRTPPGALLLAPPGRVLICTLQPESPTWSALEDRGAEVLALPADDQGRIALPALLAELGRRGVNELHVEAGVTLNGSLARAGLVDEWLVYLAPMLLGAGRAMAELGELAGLDAAPRWQFLDHTPIGPDLRLRLRLRDPAAAEALLPR